MIVHMNYGRGELPVKIADGYDVSIIKKTPSPVLDEPERAVAHALSHPIGSHALSELAHGLKSACILICDITRPVPNHLFLRPIIETLISCGLQPSRITVLVATGLHRPNEGDELAELIGDQWVLDTVQCVNHFARDDDAHVDLGVTSTRATPVKLDRRFVDADLKIATGLVEPHFMAGYSGGRKVIAPGIAHADTIRTFHSARFMADPNAVQCQLENNPLHEEQLQILQMLGPVYAVNTVIDEHRNLVHVNFGDVTQSHMEAVDIVRRMSALPVPRRFNTVLTSAAGYPLDKTYYQTVKGMVTPIDILEPGAQLIVVSDCSEGLGSAEFRASQSRMVEMGTNAFMQDISKKSLADVDEWQTQMQLKPMEIADIHLYSTGLNAQDLSLTGVNIIDNVENALADSVAKSGDHAIAVIPEGPYVVPYYSPAD